MKLFDALGSAAKKSTSLNELAERTHADSALLGQAHELIKP